MQKIWGCLYAKYPNLRHLCRRLPHWQLVFNQNYTSKQLTYRVKPGSYPITFSVTGCFSSFGNQS